MALLTLARAGALPQLGRLLDSRSLYSVGGWALQPMPALGLHLVLYVTFAAAIGVATVRAIARAAASAR